MSIDTMQNKNRPARVLLVEDNSGDVLLLKNAFSKNKILTNITVASTGEKAVVLLEESKKGTIEMPDMILLDLNLPGMNGLEVLNYLKNDERLKRIPVIILSSSSSEKDVIESYNGHANSYMIKPYNLDDLFDTARKLEQFWFAIAVLPNDEPN